MPLRAALSAVTCAANGVDFHLELGVDVVPELRDLLVGQVTNLLVRVELELSADRLRGRLTDAEDVRETDLEPLLSGEVDSGDARHDLALPLLVARVRADD